ncbi:MAG: hypothetical protein FIB06_07150 [Betaproteobacteria bacterium]|nr:hypothetical protein [Betaproteobacteria bacterium]
MAFADNFPISESLGVFVGVAGFDWLADGHAEVTNAAIVALAAGAVILTARYLLKARRKD